MLVDKELSEMNEQMKSVMESGDESLVRELAGLRMEKARMNEEFEREIKVGIGACRNIMRCLGG